MCRTGIELVTSAPAAGEDVGLGLTLAVPVAKVTM